MTNIIRKNIGIIISFLGLVILTILTFGDMGELFTEEYWKNVGGNITSIGVLSIGLSFIQYSIKQGIGEQALSKGLNTSETLSKYKEHKEMITMCEARTVYLPYFLSLRNMRETKRRKRDFLVDNSFKNEKDLLMTKNKKMKKIYDKIKVNITADSIKWSTTDIRYTKTGQIEKLDIYRKRRSVKGLFESFAGMVGTAFMTGGLFLDTYDVPLWQKAVKFLIYIFMISMSSIFSVSKNYEKGAFGVPNELSEINTIWREFKEWEIPEWVKEEIESDKTDFSNDLIKEKIDEREKAVDTTGIVQEELIESKSL